jgi:hypothetical protein
MAFNGKHLTRAASQFLQRLVYNRVVAKLISESQVKYFPLNDLIFVLERKNGNWCDFMTTVDRIRCARVCVITC